MYCNTFDLFSHLHVYIYSFVRRIYCCVCILELILFERKVVSDEIVEALSRKLTPIIQTELQWFKWKDMYVLEWPS